MTATGLNLLMLGDMKIAVDGRELDFADAVTYKGMTFCGVPNMAYALGYTNASWTLKCDLVAQYVCRLLNHMDAHGYTAATPRHPDPSVGIEPLLDFNSGYVLRSIDNLPKQGAREPVEAAPELPARRVHDAARRDRGRGAAVLAHGVRGAGARARRGVAQTTAIEGLGAYSPHNPSTNIGAAGFEPATSASQRQRADQAAPRPVCVKFKPRVTLSRWTSTPPATSSARTVAACWPPSAPAAASSRAR